MNEEKISKRKNGRKMSVLFIFILAFLSLGVGGALGYFTYNTEEKGQKTQNALVHVYDGELEYFNGSNWVAMGSFKSAQADDPFFKDDGETDNDNKAIESLRAYGITPVKVTRTYRPSSSSGSSSTVPSSPSGGDGEDITVGD